MATSAKDWKKKSAGTDLELPSGNVARVKLVGPEALLRKGVLPDALGAQVKKMINDGQGKRNPKSIADEIAKDEQSIEAMMDAVDKILVLVTLEPKVLYHRGVPTEQSSPQGRKVYRDAKREEQDQVVDIPDEDRDPETLYADEVDLEDKMFIFQFVVGGTRDIAQFRRDSKLSVGDVPDGEDDVVPSVESPGHL